MLRSSIKESKANIAPKINPTGFSGRGLVKQLTASPVRQNAAAAPSNKTLWCLRTCCTLQSTTTTLQFKEKCNETSEESPHPGVVSLCALPLLVIGVGGLDSGVAKLYLEAKKQCEEELPTQTGFRPSSAQLRDRPQLQLPTRFPWRAWLCRGGLGLPGRASAAPAGESRSAHRRCADITRSCPHLHSDETRYADE